VAAAERRDVSSEQSTQPSAAELEQTLLGERRRYTRLDVVEQVDVPMATARRFWRAMGFANVTDEAVAFTDADIDALRRITDLVKDGIIDEELALSVARAMGRNLARLTEWLGDAFTAHLRRVLSVDNDIAARLSVQEAGALLPEIEALVVYVWRRQLAATANRALSATDEELVAGSLAVGFADIVGFTRLTRRLDDHDLATVVETFEARASDIVTGAGGRVVKTVGDQVLFVANTPEIAAEIALQLAEEMALADTVPDVRVGVAVGTVLSRLGDVFGTTVHVASRLTSIAEPGTVLVDGAMASALGGNPAYDIETPWRRSLRGLGDVEWSALTRAGAEVVG
jgi:adenylate cyclase